MNRGMCIVIKSLRNKTYPLNFGQKHRQTSPNNVVNIVNLDCDSFRPDNFLAKILEHFTTQRMQVQSGAIADEPFGFHSLDCSVSSWIYHDQRLDQVWLILPDFKAWVHSTAMHDGHIDPMTSRVKNNKKSLCDFSGLLNHH